MSTTVFPGKLDAMRAQARESHVAGRLTEAIRQQIDVVNTAVRAGLVEAADYHSLGMMFFSARDFAAAVQAFTLVSQRAPDFPGLTLNLGLCLLLAEQPGKAIPPLLEHLAQHPASIDALAGLAHAFGKTGDLEQARRHGEKVLLAKDRLATLPPSAFRLPDSAPPPFRPERPQENVIAFSLFGEQERYTRGALKNAHAVPALYPGWRCRFYCDDSVPAPILAQLRAADAEVVIMPRPARPADALFWRFLVINDPAVVRFMIRDCDSVINDRERRAVAEWLDSDRFFHVLRDHAAHTDLILAGLWGGVTRVLPPIARLASGFAYEPVTESRTADQLFLGRIVWPMIKGSCLIHDSLYRCFDARDFPADARLAPGRHVGDNDFAFTSRD